MTNRLRSGGGGGVGQGGGRYTSKGRFVCTFASRHSSADIDQAEVATTMLAVLV